MNSRFAGFGLIFFFNDLLFFIQQLVIQYKAHYFKGIVDPYKDFFCYSVFVELRFQNQRWMGNNFNQCKTIEAYSSWVLKTDKKKRTYLGTPHFVSSKWPLFFKYWKQCRCHCFSQSVKWNPPARGRVHLNTCKSDKNIHTVPEIATFTTATAPC